MSTMAAGSGSIKIDRVPAGLGLAPTIAGGLVWIANAAVGSSSAAAIGAAPSVEYWGSKAILWARGLVV